MEGALGTAELRRGAEGIRKGIRKGARKCNIVQYNDNMTSKSQINYIYIYMYININNMLRFLN